MRRAKRLKFIVFREVKDQFRDWRITLPIIFLTGVFPFLIGYISNRVVQFVQSYDAEIIAENLIPFFLLVVGFFPITISLAIAIESFVGEKERKSIEPLLTSPLDDSELFLGKLIAVMFPPLFGSFIGMTVYLIGSYMRFGFVTSIDQVVLVVFLTVSQAFVMVSAAVVISSQATTVRSANLLASFIVVPMAFLIQWEAMVLFWGNYTDLWFVVVGLVILAVLFIRVGVTHFNREELIGQEFDRLNVRWMWQVFWTNFKGDASNIWSWFRVETLRTLSKLKTPIFFVCLLLLAAWFFGIHLENTYPLPEQMLDRDSLEAGFSSVSLSEILGLNAGKTVFWIWTHNIRAVLIGSVLGIFSFGILGVIITLLPFVIFGYTMMTFNAIGISTWTYLVSFVLPHGIFEAPAMIILGASILRIGAGLTTPSKGESITDGLLRAIADWAKILVGIVIPLLLVSALVETLVTSQIAAKLLMQ